MTTSPIVAQSLIIAMAKNHILADLIGSSGRALRVLLTAGATITKPQPSEEAAEPPLLAILIPAICLTTTRISIQGLSWF